MKFLKTLSDLLFPPRCVFCHRRLDEGDVCPDCQASIPRCGAIRGRGEFFSKAAAPLYYEGSVRDAMLRYKFNNRRGYARPFSRLMAECAGEELAGRFDLITWAPVSRQRLRKRGFDQSELLAAGVADALGLELTSTLRKKRHTGPNSALDGREARAANVLGAYEARNKDVLSGRHVLLVDDVYTTGATLSECSRILLMAGAEDVVCLTFAAARKANKKDRGDAQQADRQPGNGTGRRA